ncbi:uncharacterized protein BXZ73DRAFT_74824 [Epithele typhae]|uniref:uncharacterized protein n=1 Tax=Epithele typhae TaxID=378194 RepID=UPI002008071B|nr:uncharacterized protein BXZ73DRAFT_74824 [Epithele typhae]KAH9941605.1 hypothetical protein BXZ73DRAFT_74824 [Epithele typhae]
MDDPQPNKLMTSATADGRIRNLQFYSDCLIIQVGVQLFKVPRQKFEGGSRVFRDMFSLPQPSHLAVDGPLRSAEGTSEDHPLVLEGIDETEFCAFLRVLLVPLYGRTAKEKEKLTVDECIAALKLSTQWRFFGLREDVIHLLTVRDFPSSEPVRAITVAQRYDIRDFLFPALLALARREESLQLSEVESLGMVIGVKMGQVQETFVGCRQEWDIYRVHSSLTVVKRADFDFARSIRGCSGRSYIFPAT